MVAILAGAIAQPAAAQVISIKQGTFVFEGSGPDAGTGRVDISGNKGFTFVAGVSISGGVFRLYSQCQTPDCPPGANVEIDAFWNGSDLQGRATLQDKTYDDVGGLNSDTSATVAFSGSVTMPPMNDAPVSITVPFEFAGSFAYDQFTSDPQQAMLTGGGRVTLTLRPNVDRTGWELERAVFEFLRLAQR